MSYEDLSIKEAQHFYRLGSALNEAALIHGLSVLGDGVAEHVCGFDDPEYKEKTRELQEFTLEDLNAFLSYEHATLANFKIMRAGLRAQGFPVEENISTESIK